MSKSFPVLGESLTNTELGDNKGYITYICIYSVDSSSLIEIGCKYNIHRLQRAQFPKSVTLKVISTLEFL